MEFLDDLIKNQDPGKQPEQEIEADDDADDGWNNLIRGIAYEDPLAQNRTDQPTKRALSSRNTKSPARGRSPKTLRARRRRRILIFLAISVFTAWGIIFAVILRMANNNTLPRSAQSGTLPTPQAAVTQDAVGAIVPAEGPEEMATEPAAAAEVQATPVPLPTPPSVEGAPFTRFDREIQESPALIDLYQLRGQEYIDLGAYEAALADFQHAKAMDDSRAEVYAGIGRVYFHMRRWNEAELAFQAALERNPILSDAHFWLGHIYFYKGEYKPAYTAFDMAAEYDRSSAEAEAWLAMTSAQLGDYQETLGAATRAMSITHDLAVVYVASSWANLLEEPADVDGAQGDLLYARELEPNSFVTLNSLASFYLNYRPERLAEAELLAHYAENWAQNDIERALALQTLGRIYLVKGLKADAEKIFVQAMELATVDGFVVLAGLPDDFARSRE